MDFWLKSYFEVKQRNGCLEMLGLHFLAKDPFKIMHPKYFQRTNFRSIGFQVNQNISEKNLRKLEAHLKTLLLYTNRSKNYLWRSEKKSTIAWILLWKRQNDNFPEVFKGSLWFEFLNNLEAIGVKRRVIFHSKFRILPTMLIQNNKEPIFSPQYYSA